MFQITASAFNLGPQTYASGACVGGFAANDDFGGYHFCVPQRCLMDGRQDSGLSAMCSCKVYTRYSIMATTRLALQLSHNLISTRSLPLHSFVRDTPWMRLFIKYLLSDFSHTVKPDTLITRVLCQRGIPLPKVERHAALGVDYYREISFVVSSPRYTRIGVPLGVSWDVQ